MHFHPSQAGPAPLWLPLYGWKGGGKGGKRVDAGEIQVAAWWQAGGGTGQQGEWVHCAAGWWGE